MKLTAHLLSFRRESYRSPSISSGPHKTTSKPFPRVFLAPSLEASFSRLTSSLPRKEHGRCQDTCSKPSAHRSGLQKRAVNYLECPLPSWLFISPEISPSSLGGLKIKFTWPLHALAWNSGEAGSSPEERCSLTPTGCCETSDSLSPILSIKQTIEPEVKNTQPQRPFAWIQNLSFSVS